MQGRSCHDCRRHHPSNGRGDNPVRPGTETERHGLNLDHTRHYLFHLRPTSTMKSSTILAVGFMLCAMVLTSRAFLFNDNMWMYFAMNPNFMNSMFGGNAQSGAGTPGMNPMSLAMMSSGSDNMKNLGTGMLLSSLFRSGEGAGPTAGR
ncbi:hypothetical protein RRG08_040743 [Elysia crispata]|uniref:Uncharacterized protein n=1 Tax=Elysia crispata TaxID=231223 RepID=A0AAE1BF25_9GAST|nr:hypothetical protein RRG08_040743 [Elysia crispata]